MTPANRHLLIVAALVALVACAAELSAGQIAGRITYDNRVPRVTGDTGDCERVDSVRSAVLVTVLNPPAGGRRGAPVSVEIRNCQFQTRVVGLMIGQSLGFKNRDGIPHNVHGLPKENREFNIGMPPTTTNSINFRSPERPFPVKCDAHPWMTSYVAVMTHPYFAVTDDRGSFSIDGLPAGSYSVQAWHERLGTRTFMVEIDEGASEPVDWRF